MIQSFDFTVYIFLDPRESLYFVPPHVAMNFDTWQLSGQFSVSTLVGESILVEKVYRDCCHFPISTNHKSIMDDLVELDIVEFNVILFMG